MASAFHAIVCSLILHAKQVPQATEEAVLAVISLYPTLLSLVQAYSMLVSPLSLPTYAMLFSFRALRSYSKARTNVSNVSLREYLELKVFLVVFKDGDRRAQEEMLMNKCNLVKAGASKAIFKFVWAEG